MSEWSSQEIHRTVATYLEMLTLELSGQRYSKAALNRELIDSLRGRSRAAIEFKHCNISAVMIMLGYPSIIGYKPRRNFQRALIDEVIKQVNASQLLDLAALQAVEQTAVAPRTIDFEKIVTPAPRQTPGQQAESAPPYIQKRDYLAIEARNRSLGLAGEEFVLRYEDWRLRQAGQTRLANRIEHTSAERGDGAGYDIHSFETSGKPRYIEVKTTAYSERTPFWISANEVRFAREHDVEFRLARVYEFRRRPRFFILPGEVERHCELDTTTYKARLR